MYHRKHKNFIKNTKQLVKQNKRMPKFYHKIPIEFLFVKVDN